MYVVKWSERWTLLFNLSRITIPCSCFCDVLHILTTYVANSINTNKLTCNTFHLLGSGLVPGPSRGWTCVCVYPFLLFARTIWQVGNVNNGVSHRSTARSWLTSSVPVSEVQKIRKHHATQKHCPSEQFRVCYLDRKVSELALHLSQSCANEADSGLRLVDMVSSCGSFCFLWKSILFEPEGRWGSFLGVLLE